MNKPTVITFSPDVNDEHEALPEDFKRLLEKHSDADHWCLDMGTGRGRVTFFLAPRVRWVLGLDKRSEPIEDARRIAQNEGIVNVQFMVANVEQTMLAEMSPVGSFQLVTSNLFLSRKAIELCRSAVAEDGHLCCVCFADDHWQETGRRSGHSFTEDELKEMLSDNGFGVDFFKRHTVRYDFENLDQVREFLSTSLQNKWREDGRWQELEKSFAAGRKSLTESKFIFSASHK